MQMYTLQLTFARGENVKRTSKRYIRTHKYPDEIKCLLLEHYALEISEGWVLTDFDLCPIDPFVLVESLPNVDNVNNKPKATATPSIMIEREEKVNSSCNLLYEAKKKSMMSKGIVLNETILYHGTPEQNIPSITSEGFSLAFIGKTTGNDGYYGKGIYFTTNLEIANMYSRESNKILKCRVLLGRHYLCDYCESADLEFGYDSHVTLPHKEEREYVVFEPSQIWIESICFLKAIKSL